ncbi:9173_t:CDS:1, partial [Entrophospora sp. SA101]
LIVMMKDDDNQNKNKNFIEVELKISCQSPEVIFFVEAAMLTRLNELTIIKSKNDANKGDANMMDIDDKS